MKVGGRHKAVPVAKRGETVM